MRSHRKRFTWITIRTLPFFLFAAASFCQMETGELRLTVTDPAGLPVQAAVELVSEVNQYQRTFEADAAGRVTAKRLPFGLYTIEVRLAGFMPSSNLIDIHSEIPQELKVALAIAPVATTINVSESTGETLIDPYRTNTINRIGGDTLTDRLASLPGRSLADMVSQEPGWVFEANGILHPRGEEYQTQYVMDGIPLTDNRSAAYVPDFDVDNVQEMSVMTAGFPAEYGRKLGGVIEVETARDARQGFHGRFVASGGSFDTADGYFEGQHGWGTNTLSFSTSAAATDRFLDPPVTQNYTNHGTNADFMAHYERDIGNSDRIGVIFRREQSRFLVPNEIIQEEAGQRQDRSSDETALQFSYQHTFSPNLLGDLRAMARDITAAFWSNPLSTPMIADQDRSYREGYAKGTLSLHEGKHELKIGVEADYAGIREALGYQITDPTQFDPATPLSFNFLGHAPDREQAAFVQDMIRWKNFTLSAGLRFDHYDLLVDQSAWSPARRSRLLLAAGRYCFSGFVRPDFPNPRIRKPSGFEFSRGDQLERPGSALTRSAGPRELL